MNGAGTRDDARSRIAELVARFVKNEADYLRLDYNETQARTEFITPLLEAFGWDVHNTRGHPLALREVKEEATVEVGEERLSKRPDYELRLARQRKIFVEAKKPSVHIDRDRAAAFQIRRYGYSASMPISVVTNFHQLAIYDCEPSPADTDEAHVARSMLVGYQDLEARFDELWPLLSREAIYSGAFDRRFAVGTTRRGADQFDDLFLKQVRNWRELLAIDIHANSPTLSPEELTYVVQLFLSRIVFLRICEDREIENYDTLRNLDKTDTFDALISELRRADKFYDSGLFSLLNDKKLGVRISDGTLQRIISELYYPQSPYTFAAVDTEVLGEIYEQFLGDVITIDKGVVVVENKPEVRESGGVVPTPGFIADAIVTRTLEPSVAGKSPAELEGFTVADICCGSGAFLLSAYGFLLDHYLSWYLDNDRAAHAGRSIYEAVAGQWRLTFEEKRRILVNHIRGVDIDSNAAEVTQFSLLLKLIEDESAAALKDFVGRHHEAALPPLDGNIRCGNSLVDDGEWVGACGAMPAALREKVNPFIWADEFADEMARGGFDVIVGNPPYIRIQNMVAYSQEEVSYYQSPRSPFTTGRQNNFDKYALFIERYLTLVQPTGRIGVIVPHKFMSIQAGRALRHLLSAGSFLEQVVHFGAKQVFGRGTSNYTCILILDREGSGRVLIEMAGPIEEWRYGHAGKIGTKLAAELGEEPWEFVNDEARALFARLLAASPERLSTVADILVGLQTSADKVYILHPERVTAHTVTCRWDGRDWQIERGILLPSLHDVELQAYVPPQANSWMIFPYELVSDASGSERARLIQPDEMKKRFPGCWAYLNARRKELEGRDIIGGPADEKQWYQYGRSQSLTKFNGPKIILPVLSREPRYCYDNCNTLFTGGGNGPYYMVRARDKAEVSDLYLLAVLNHPLSEAIVRTNTSVFRGGYYSHGKQFIENIPVPIAKEEERQEIEQLVSQLISALQSLDAARTPHERTRREREATSLRRAIEGRVNAIFGLTEADIGVVQSVPVPE